jgi:hypothetical protein
MFILVLSIVLGPWLIMYPMHLMGMTVINEIWFVALAMAISALAGLLISALVSPKVQPVKRTGRVTRSPDTAFADFILDRVGPVLSILAVVALIAMVSVY